jgi:hypothetical protein
LVEFRQFVSRGPRKIEIQRTDLKLKLVALEWEY